LCFCHSWAEDEGLSWFCSCAVFHEGLLQSFISCYTLNEDNVPCEYPMSLCFSFCLFRIYVFLVLQNVFMYQILLQEMAWDSLAISSVHVIVSQDFIRPLCLSKRSPFQSFPTLTNLSLKKKKKVRQPLLLLLFASRLGQYFHCLEPTGNHHVIFSWKISPWKIKTMQNQGKQWLGVCFHTVGFWAF
jgi:hypothetical protein